ncbi:MAG: hypothetical protein R3C59_03970 [Planctomycetaceae bacterium]
MRIQQLAVLGSTVIILISGCSAGRSTSRPYASGGGSWSGNHAQDSFESPPPSQGIRQFEPPPVPPVPATRGISMTRTISFGRILPAFGCGEKSCGREADCTAPQASANQGCVPDTVCEQPACRPWLGRFRCWPRRPQAPCIPAAACTSEAPCTQEYGSPLCQDACGDSGCGQTVPHRCFLSRLFCGRLHLFGHPKSASCPPAAGCTDMTCMNSTSVGSASPDSDVHHAGPTPPPIFDDAPASASGSQSHERSPLAEPMQDPFAPAGEDIKNNNQKVPSPVPAPPKFVAPQTNNLSGQPVETTEVPSAPDTVRPMPLPMPIPAPPAEAEAVEAPQTWVEPKLWPRHSGLMEPAIVVQPRDFHARSTAWNAQ